MEAETAANGDTSELMMEAETAANVNTSELRMEAERTDIMNSADTLTSTPQLTIPCQELLKGQASQAALPVTNRDIHRAKAMPSNQYARLGSTASKAVPLVSKMDFRRANVTAFNRFTLLRVTAFQTGHPIDERDIRDIRDICKAKVMPVNQFAHLDSTEWEPGALPPLRTGTVEDAGHVEEEAGLTLEEDLTPRAVAETATSNSSYREPDIPASRSQHQAELKTPKQQRVRDYSQQLTLQVASGSTGCMENKQLVGFVPKTVPTKLKTTTPDVDKNDEYYEKRKRNNIAARKSRENKRSSEEAVKRKVSIMEKENAILLQEITKIKKRHGLSLEESVMTPEERKQCDIEINLLKADEVMPSKNPSRKDVSPASGPDTQSDVEQLEEVSIGRPLGTAATSDARAKEEHASTSFTYGPPIYGPYNPSPCWTPVMLQPPYIPVQKYPIHAGHSSGIVPVDCFVNRSMGVFMPPPFRHYIPFENQGTQIRSRPGSDYRSYTEVAPNLNVIRGKGHNEEMGLSAISSSEALNMSVGRTGGSSVSATQPFHSSTDQVNYMGDAPSIMSSSGNEFCGPFKVPLPIAPSRNSKPAEIMPSIGQYDPGNQHVEVLRQQSEVLKRALQSLPEDMQRMKSKMHKDELSE